MKLVKFHVKQLACVRNERTLWKNLNFDLAPDGENNQVLLNMISHAQKKIKQEKEKTE